MTPIPASIFPALDQKPFHLIYWVSLSTLIILVIAFEKYTLTSLHLLWHVEVIEGRISLGRISYVDSMDCFGETPETSLSVTIWYLACEVSNEWKDTAVVHYLRLFLAVVQELQALYHADQ